ncbi:MAG: hypothetical protein J6C84_07115 [Lachnospiraceae bacterium]|nr:hypothetical protein [Lachnospiraceae bacterium]
MIFKCKNCGGNVVYSPEKHKMFCPYCDSEDSEERSDAVSSGIQICPNCGGEVPVGEHTSATQCPYCDNYLIFNERVEGEYAPAHIIPFQIGKESCKSMIREKFKKCRFAPIDFLSEVRLNSMEGDYVPFWFYDFDTNCDFQAEGTKVRCWTSGNTEYTETSYYHVVRNMDVAFKKIPVDASVKMPDDIMDLMEPYEYQGLVEFKPEYMSGFYGEKYNMPATLVMDRAKMKMMEDTKEMLKASYSGYSRLKVERQQINVNNVSENYGLLPVWKYIYHYKDKEYPFYVNGQTGKIVGTAPLSKAKVWAYTGTLWGCLTLILALVCEIAGYL